MKCVMNTNISYLFTLLLERKLFFTFIWIVWNCKILKEFIRKSGGYYRTYIEKTLVTNNASRVVYKIFGKQHLE